MKVAFAGPSLYGVERLPQDIEIRPPAAQGDMVRAIDEGADIVGLIDGYFGWTASVWHKEILYGLSLGVAVLGASSMGALRAAECAAFGMIAVGGIASRYCSGELVDDDAVALTNLPGEFGYMPVTEPLVDVVPTIGVLASMGVVIPSVALGLEAHARAIHFTDRTVAAICALPGLAEGEQQRLCELYEANRVRTKRDDAALMLERMSEMAARPRRPAPTTWSFQTSPMWEQVRAGVTPLYRS